MSVIGSRHGKPSGKRRCRSSTDSSTTRRVSAPLKSCAGNFRYAISSSCSTLKVYFVVACYQLQVLARHRAVCKVDSVFATCREAGGSGRHSSRYMQLHVVVKAAQAIYQLFKQTAPPPMHTAMLCCQLLPTSLMQTTQPPMQRLGRQYACSTLPCGMPILRTATQLLDD